MRGAFRAYHSFLHGHWSLAAHQRIMSTEFLPPKGTSSEFPVIHAHYDYPVPVVITMLAAPIPHRQTNRQASRARGLFAYDLNTGIRISLSRHEFPGVSLRTGN